MSAGADHIIVTDEEDLAERGMAITANTGARIVFDPIAEPFLEKLARGKQYIYDGLKSSSLKPIIDRTFPLDAIAEAHRYMESNQQKGKIVVTV